MHKILNHVDGMRFESIEKVGNKSKNLISGMNLHFGCINLLLICIKIQRNTTLCLLLAHPGDQRTIVLCRLFDLTFQ